MRAGARIAEPDAAAAREPGPSVAAERGAAAPFLLLAPLGASAVCETWHARDAAGRELALKMLRPEWATPAGERLLRHEHGVLAGLEHPHIVRTFGLVVHDGRLALALEHVGGGDLAALAGAAPRHWLAAAAQTLAALRHLHAAGWAHRDVKARNVLLDARGGARLIDFGSAARLGAAPPAGGTTAEHARPGRADRVEVADDAYAFAVLLHELIRGRLPARGDVPAQPQRGADERLVERLFRAVTGLLARPAEPGAGSLCELANVIESVVPAA